MKQKTAKKKKGMWVDTYRPTSWQEFIGNGPAISLCKNWLKDFQNMKWEELLTMNGKKKKKKKGEIELPAALPAPPPSRKRKQYQHQSEMNRILLISGPEGCGKSVAAELLLKKQGYRIYTFGMKDIKNHKGDRKSFDNFCSLYMSKINAAVAANKKTNMHGIIIEDFEGIARNDKPFNATLFDFFKKNYSNVPIIITTRDGNFGKYNYGLLRLCKVIYFQAIPEKDLTKVAQRIAIQENLYLDNDQAELFAAHVHGDCRQLIMTMEMFYGLKKTATSQIKPVTLAEIQSYLQETNVMSDEKICNLATSSVSSQNLTDDEKIIHTAIFHTTPKYQQSAIRLIVDNSLQFTPFLFQLYLNLLHQSSNDDDSIIIDIADDFSTADVIRDSFWNMEGYLDTYGVLSCELCIHRLQMLFAATATPKKLNINLQGYQTYYGTENIINNTQKSLTKLKELSYDFGIINPSTISFVSALYNHYIAQCELDSTQIRPMIKQLYPIKPEFLETINKTTSATPIARPFIKQLEKEYEEEEKTKIAEHCVLQQSSNSFFKKQKCSENTTHTPGTYISFD